MAKALTLPLLIHSHPHPLCPAAAWTAAHQYTQVPSQAVAWWCCFCCRQVVTCVCTTSRVAHLKTGLSRVVPSRAGR
jgi:hypothetical protein